MKQAILFILLCIIFTGCNKQTQQIVTTEKVDATQLEKDIWANFGDDSYLQKNINDSFQSSHSDGARGKQEEIKLIKGLNVKNHQFSDFRATQNENVAVVTYNISVTVTLDGKEATLPSSQRQSTWIKTDKGWQWISHANLEPLIK